MGSHLLVMIVFTLEMRDLTSSILVVTGVACLQCGLRCTVQTTEPPNKQSTADLRCGKVSPSRGGGSWLDTSVPPSDGPGAPRLWAQRWLTTHLRLCKDAGMEAREAVRSKQRHCSVLNLFNM